jgi:hypothetical protein
MKTIPYGEYWSDQEASIKEKLGVVKMSILSNHFNFTAFLKAILGLGRGVPIPVWNKEWSTVNLKMTPSGVQEI